MYSFFLHAQDWEASYFGILRCSERFFLIGYSSPYYFCSTYVDSHERMITVEDFKVWIDCRHP